MFWKFGVHLQVDHRENDVFLTYVKIDKNWVTSKFQADDDLFCVDFEHLQITPPFRDKGIGFWLYQTNKTWTLNKQTKETKRKVPYSTQCYNFTCTYKPYWIAIYKCISCTNWPYARNWILVDMIYTNVLDLRFFSFFIPFHQWNAIILRNRTELDFVLFSLSVLNRVINQIKKKMKRLIIDLLATVFSAVIFFFQEMLSKER